MTTLDLRRGDDYVSRPLDILITLSGVPLALTGMTLWFMVKRQQGDLDADALISRKTPTDLVVNPDQAGAGKGKATVTIPRSVTDTLPTGTFYGEVQGKDAAGEIITLWSNRVRVLPDLVQAES